jgi:quercetin dioxygenase-like cupin family protein
VDVVAAQVVVPCTDLDATLSFFVDRLGFRVEEISPADDPHVAVVSAYGVRLRLDSTVAGPPTTLRLLCSAATSEPSLALGAVLAAPGGTTVEFVSAERRLVVPSLRPSLAVSRAADESTWVAGRAGMQYRDLDPSRQGGRFIASHIRIVEGGPVSDYVHFHRIAFQIIYCVRGWVEVVYEEQGEPFVMHEGDCVLQPPLIRHRVLQSSPGLEVIEVGSPAVHDTFGDLEMTLPTPTTRPERSFDGQRFLRSVAGTGGWRPWRAAGFECRDTGVGAASAGIAGVHTVRRTGSESAPPWSHDGELLLMFVLQGGVVVDVDHGGPCALTAGDSLVVPPGTDISMSRCARDLQWLEVTAPG